MLVTQSGQTLEQIVASVKKVSDIVAEIAAASREQSSGIEQVNRAVMQMDELTQQNAALVEQATAASQAMADQARELNEMMARYQVARDGNSPQRWLRVVFGLACADAQRERRRYPRRRAAHAQSSVAEACRCRARSRRTLATPAAPRKQLERRRARIRTGRSSSCFASEGTVSAPDSDCR